MKLYYAPASPYARKCWIMAIEAGITIELVADNPNDQGAKVVQHNPLGKVPALVLNDGACIFDSTVICEFFASQSATLIPSESQARLKTKLWEAIGDGICDAALAARMEGLRKEITDEGRAYIARQRGKIDRALNFASTELENRSLCVGSHFTLGDAALISALGYLDFRFPDIGWRSAHANLVRYADAHAVRLSVTTTKPVA